MGSNPTAAIFLHSRSKLQPKTSKQSQAKNFFIKGKIRQKRPKLLKRMKSQSNLSQRKESNQTYSGKYSTEDTQMDGYKKFRSGNSTSEIMSQRQLAKDKSSLTREDYQPNSLTELATTGRDSGLGSHRQPIDEENLKHNEVVVFYIKYQTIVNFLFGALDVIKCLTSKNNGSEFLGTGFMASWHIYVALTCKKIYGDVLGCRTYGRFFNAVKKAHLLTWFSLFGNLLLVCATLFGLYLGLGQGGQGGHIQRKGGRGRNPVNSKVGKVSDGESWGSERLTVGFLILVYGLVLTSPYFFLYMMKAKVDVSLGYFRKRMFKVVVEKTAEDDDD